MKPSKDMSVFERINDWVRGSVSLKLMAMGILTLLMLIPVSMIESIIREREYLSQEAIREVSSKWANTQVINGPILTVPMIYWYEEEDKVMEGSRNLHFLPEELSVDGMVEPEQLRRGIYEVVVYRSMLHYSGNFIPDHALDWSHLKEIQWDRAFLTVGISDLRGIQEAVELNWNGTTSKALPGSGIPDIIQSGITFEVPLQEPQAAAAIPFQFELVLQGSQNLSFIPLGSSTKVNLTSPWSSPSFNGNFLPDERTVSEDGFTAEWKVLQLNRNFPQSWTSNNAYGDEMKKTVFGVDLMLPLDDYQKSIRSVKYGIMTIALTFLIFFLVEMLTDRRIHPFQYILVGLALSVFYVLLVSISEHSNFNIAYLVSTFAVVSTISLYSTSVFKRGTYTLVLLAALLGIYGFLFIILQLADYALLMGSIGLLLILAATMYFTRHIDWYGSKEELVE